MVTVTIQALLSGAKPPAIYCVYVVRDRRFVLYVGQTKWGAGLRIRDHVEGDRFSNGPTVLGCLIVTHSPKSDAWAVDLYRVDDCAKLVRKHYPTGAPTDAEFFGDPKTGQTYLEGVIDQYAERDRINRQRRCMAEHALIREHRPALNVADNPNPHPLPSKYRRRTR